MLFANNISTALENHKLLESILQGKTLSRTGLKERGKGLPQIFELSKHDYFEKFIIISNDVYGDLKEEKYNTLEQAFRGTFLYWELNLNKLQNANQRHNKNC